MKTETRLIIGSTVFIILFGMVSNFVINSSAHNQSETFSSSWACTADIQVCPDGREVTRTPPYCQFASCNK